MTHAIEVLRQEHVSMARLLQLMDKLQRELASGQPPDYPLLNDISDYLQGFPDACHHPKEDLIFQKLGERDPEFHELGSDLEFEHGRLAKLTRRFAELLQAAQADEDASLDAFIRALSELVRTYRRHMAMEEKHLFPLAINKLRLSDWAEINSAVFEQTDPLADAASSRYQLIRDKISELAEEHDERKRLLEGPSLETDLESLQTIEQLHDILASLHYEFRLGKTEQGGYRLTENGKTVLALPPCSESRAVWCAYSYIRACT
jgi:hemerythrin-like domain-containing protein